MGVVFIDMHGGVRVLLRVVGRCVGWRVAGSGCTLGYALRVNGFWYRAVLFRGFGGIRVNGWIWLIRGIVCIELECYGCGRKIWLLRLNTGM